MAQNITAAAQRADWPVSFVAYERLNSDGKLELVGRVDDSPEPIYMLVRYMGEDRHYKIETMERLTPEQAAEWVFAV